MIDVKALAATLLNEVREWATPAFEAVRERLDSQDAAIKAIPPAKEIDPVLIEAAVAKAISALPKPKDGEDAVVDYDRLGSIVKSTVGAAVAALPEPKPGKDAVVDYDRIGVAIKEAVAVAVSEIPKPRDGKDVDMDALQKDIDARFAALMTSAESRIDVRLEAAVRAIPAPKEPAVDYDRIGNAIKEVVATAVSEIPKPKDGEPGRDAATIVPLDGLDPSKSYPRGTWVLHQGGLITALRSTDPVVDGDILKAGWAVAMNGIASITEQEVEDARFIERTTVYTSGKSVVERRRALNIRYRGVFSPESEYQLGDVVTWGGSSWHCNVETTKNRPDDGSGHWTLAVKRGRDGK